MALKKVNAMKSLNAAVVSWCLVGVAAFQLNAERQVKTINDNWDFKFPEAKEWTRIVIPHTFNDDAYRMRDYYKGKGFYRRNLRMDSIDSGKRYFLKFDGANKAADVSVNGHEMDSHVSGYTSFVVDVTDFLNRGDNEVVVTVDNSRADIGPVSADFTFWGGIYRDVWMLTVPSVHFDMADYGSNGVAISIPEVNDRRAEVEVNSGIKNDSPSEMTVVVKTSLIDPDGNVVKNLRRNLKIQPGETKNVVVNVDNISSPKLWSPETPNLYAVKSELIDAVSGNKLDEVVNPLGFRWFGFDGEKGFSLNGKLLKLRGVNRHQDMAPLGWALSDDAHRRDFELIKEIGANFVRLAHYPQDDAALDACDRLGLLVWEEIPVVNRVDSIPGFDDNAERGLVEMIRQHRNHPSVIGWGYMNEILLRAPGDNDSSWTGVRNHTLDLAHRLEKRLKEEDSSRVSFMAFHGSDRYNKVGLNIADVVGWNLYQGWYGGDLTGFDRYLEDQHRRFPDKPIIVSEWGAGSDRRLHSMAPVPFDFSIEYQQKYVEHYLPYIENHDYVAGGAYWNFIDFNVAERQESMPRVNNKGILYNNRDFKDVAYYFKSAWRDDEAVLHIAVDDWGDRYLAEGQLMPIKIYGNVDEVELQLNGHSLGKKKLENFNCVFPANLNPGKSILVARGVKDGEEIRDVATVSLKGCPDVMSGETLAINVGGNCSFESDHDGMLWLPDRRYEKGGWGYVGGKSKSTTAEIFNTLDGPLYQTSREGLSEYRIDVPNGRYEVELLMTDVNRPSTLSPYLLGRNQVDDKVRGESRIAIEINGRSVEKDFSPSDGDNYFQPVRRRYVVENNEGSISVKFIPLSGTTTLSGMMLRRL
ncbi:MAG: DUF4982 domain-containing protein [Bacteroides sp.]|nr:DUF4982 domain-containing protein [Bacteroides sp.]